MSEEKPITINVADAEKLTAKVKAFQKQLSTAERTLFDAIIANTIVEASPDGVAIAHLWPWKPWLPHIPRPHAGATIIGGAGGPTIIIGADGHIRFLPPDPDGY
jgi:predicted dehydrogenase